MKITSQNRTSTSYRFTVKMVDGQVAPEDQEYVSELRNLIKKTNAQFSDYSFYTPLRVKLQGRGPRAAQSRRDYGGRSRCYDKALPLGLATTADVYVYNRT